MFFKYILPFLTFTVVLITCTSEENFYANKNNNNPSKDWSKNSELQCYDCNSKYDPRCGDPFSEYSIGTVNCSKKIPEHLMHLAPYYVCRKITQIIEGQKRVIRECGFLPDKNDDKKCIRRTGTANIQSFYCSCTTPLCNTGSTIRPILILINLIIIVGLFLITVR